MKNGWTIARPVSGANNPFLTICNKNGGASCEFWGGGGERRTATTTRIGTPASAAAKSHVRQRRTCFESSTRNIDALHEMEEDVFERVSLGFQRLHPYAATDEGGVHVGRPETVRRLVGHQQIGVAQECQRDAESLAHPLAVVLHTLVSRVRQADGVQDIVDPVEASVDVSPAAPCARERLQVAPPREVRPERR